MMRRGAFITVGLLACTMHVNEAAAATKAECISNFDLAQRSKREGHLKQAHDSALICSQSECPAVVRQDCGDILKTVDVAQPSIVVGAADAKGNDLTDVTVELDGKPILTTLDGRAVNVDPGKLTLTIKRAPWDPVVVEIVIKEAEKNRTVHVTLGPPAPAAPPAAMKPSPAELEPAPQRSAVGYAVPGAFAAIGVGALVFAGITRLGAGGDADDLKSSCGPVCPQSERDSLSGDLTRANIFLGVGIGSLVIAAASWFIFSPPAPQKRGALPLPWRGTF